MPTARLSGRARRRAVRARRREHIAVLAAERHGPVVALVETKACRIGERPQPRAASPPTRVTFERVKPLRARRPAGFDRDGADADGRGGAQRADRRRAARRSSRSASRYANERVAFERPIGKFQAVQQNLARLAGEAAAALAAAGSAADTIAHARRVRRRRVSGSGLGQNPLRRSRDRRLGDRASGVRRDRLHQRAHAASLHAAHARLARRFRQRELVGGRARQPRRARAARTNSGRWWRSR